MPVLYRGSAVLKVNSSYLHCTSTTPPSLRLKCDIRAFLTCALTPTLSKPRFLTKCLTKGRLRLDFELFQQAQIFKRSKNT